MERPRLVPALVIALLAIVLAQAAGFAAARSQPPAQPSALILGTSYELPAAPDQAKGGTAVAAAAMSEGFEGLWPSAAWQLNSGAYTVGRRNCRAHGGAYAGWMAGGGSGGEAIACGGSYPNGANVTMRYGPFDLRGAQSAALRFSYWGRTEFEQSCSFDKFVALSSADGTNFSGLTACGDFTGGTAGNGFYAYTLDLSSRLGQPQVWVLLGFISDSTVSDIGVIVDDIVLDVVTDGPTPTHTATPTSTSTATATSTVPAAAAEVPVGFLPIIVREIAVATATPTPTATPTATQTASDRPRVTVRGVRTSSQLTCYSGTTQIVQRPSAGYTFLIIDFTVTNPHPGQALTFSRDQVSALGSDGVSYPADGEKGYVGSSYCMGGSAQYAVYGASGDYSFVFVPAQATVSQPYQLRFPGADPVSARVGP